MRRRAGTGGMASEFSKSAGAVAHTIAVWAFFWALYLLFAGKTSAPELATGAVVAGLGAAYQMALRCKTEPPRLAVSALLPLPAALAAVVRDSFRVGAGLMAALFGAAAGGRVRVVAPPAGADARSAAGEAVAIAAASLAPNSYVLASDVGHGRMVVHRLLDRSEEQA